MPAVWLHIKVESLADLSHFISVPCVMGPEAGDFVDSDDNSGKHTIESCWFINPVGHFRPGKVFLIRVHIRPLLYVRNLYKMVLRQSKKISTMSRKPFCECEVKFLQLPAEAVIL